MHGKEWESTNVTRTYDNAVNKHKETSSMYDNEGEEKTLRTFKKKEKARDGYVSMYQYVK